MKITKYVTVKTHKSIVCTWAVVFILFFKIKVSNFELQSGFQFKHDIYNVTIPENSVGKTYALPNAQEDFIGISIIPNVDVKYRVISGDRDKLFKAEEKIVGNFAFLIIRTRTSNVVLNREKNEEYMIKVRAIINSVNNKNILNYETETSVHITVLDRNDLSPFFYPTEYSKAIPEDFSTHKTILKVNAEDADLGVNGEIYYSFLMENEYFGIHPTTGEISLMRHLSFAETSHFELTVLANDRGSAVNHYGHHTSKAKVFITVEQVNLHAPEIYAKTLSTLSTNFSSEIYGIIRVNDKDQGRHGEIKKLEIVDGNPDGNFYITSNEDDKEYYLKVNRFAKLEQFPYIYNLTLRAEDSGLPVKFSYKTISVPMLPEVTSSPVFSKQLYEVAIPETSPPNMPVIRLKVTDPDLGKNALVVLEIVGGNEGGEFRIHPDTGMLYTQKLLDAENKSFYTLTVSAVDQANMGTRKQSSAKVKINIQDMNDNDPIFDKINTTLTINENELAGSFVTKLSAKDKDSGENSYITYSIANLNDVPFEIDHFSGIIRTTTLIDYETMRRHYLLSIRASDWGLPYRRQTELELLIQIRDINDNRPQFERVNCIGKILRDVPVGTDIFTISAIDFDVGDYITYRLTSGNEDGCFNLDPSTGVLSITCDLTDVGVTDRVINVSSTDGTHFSDEMYLQLQLINTNKNNAIDNVNILKGYGSFECRETGISRRFAANLAASEKNNVNSFEDLHINDLALTPSRYGENIHTPEFIEFPTELKINESVQLGETIIWIRGRDRDLGYNGKLVFAISDGDNDSVFRIDPDNGDLQVIGYLDRERQEEYVLNITVYDLGQPQKSDSKMLPITIIDNNDNRPIFQKSLARFRITENALNGTLIFCLNASDADLDKNAMITYVMQTESKHFYINKVTGCLYLKADLDREKQEEHELHIIAKDSGMPPLSSEAVINIIVEDINDNAPIFGVQEFLFKVREDIPRGTVVASIEAFDFDSGPNSEIYFSLKEDVIDESLFKIDKHTGVIRTQGFLDYETRQVHNLVVSAIDHGSPSLTSDMPIVIEILDVNENRYAPEFDDFVYITKVRENQSKGYIIANFMAKDLDSNDLDSRISYSIRGGDGLGIFAINDQGSLRVTSHLDAETKDNYWLTLCAQDQAIVPLSSCVQVFVEVENENDNVPLTNKPIYYQNVLEGSPSKSRIIQLKAFDKDEDLSQIISYKIVSGNPEGFFFINSSTGELTTTERKLDRENQAEHIIEVLICDNGLPPLSSTTRVVIIVEDINDHTPEFDQRFYKVQVPSTIAINASVFQVQAIDNDIGNNGRISYNIKSGKGKNKFRIDHNTGIIYVLKTLEKETEYDLNIRAEDNGSPKKSQTARLNIVVLPKSNKSQNPPIMKTIDSIVDVTESDRPGFLVALIQATDRDEEHLWYTICGGDDRNEFYIGRDNGNILLSKTLNWQIQKSYNLSICVTDGDYIVQTQLYVNVVDTNNNMPQFSKDVYYVNISESIDEETVIMQLHAADNDEDKKIFYTLHGAQDPASLSLFRIDSITGNVLVSQRLDYEKNAHHILIVSAKDQGTPAKRDYAKIVITVHDHNDHYPEFTSKIFQSKIPESAVVGSKIAQLLAIDRDSGKNGEIKYSIITGNIGNTFEIDSSLGIINLAKNLNIIQMQEYMLQVKATDLGEPPLSTQIAVHILITMSENDPPRYVSETIVLEINENLPAGSFVSQVEARSSSTVFYNIVNGNSGDFFHINPSTGIIVTNNMIDFEKYRSFNLTVSGTNMASASSNCSVIVHIIDINDNAPLFMESDFFGEISEAAPIGTVILGKNGLKNSPLKLEAFDLDMGINGMIEYSILDDTTKNLFQIDSSTGTIKLMQPLDYESIKEYKFKVMVNDKGLPKMYSSSPALVHVFVRNVNDCPPHFKEKEYNVTLHLPTYDNVLVTQVIAIDADMDDNTRIRYDVVDGNLDGCFQINPATGILTTRIVQRLNKPFYKLHVRASDGLYSTIAQIGVNVITLDSSGFVFQKSNYDFSTVENSTKVTTIGIVNVVGNILHEDVMYKILNPSNTFQIGTTSGAIKTTGIIFDREVQDNYKLVVEAKSVSYYNKENIIHRAITLVDITILDINDNCPLFVNLPYYATVSIDDLKGSVITKVTAIDLDKNENGEVRYEMKKGIGELFKIDRKNGELSLRQSIEGHNRSFSLTVAAYDGAVTPCSTDVLVHIKVVDKSMPIFDKQFYSDVVREDAELFSALSMSIQAASPLNRKLIYTISEGNTKELFEIDYRTGTFYLANKLDFEETHTHEVVVRATDSVSGIYADVTVSINVEDANDCYPDIENDNYNVTLPENLTPGTKILKINASDCDSGVNKELTYLIESQNTNEEVFYIDMTDGSIYLKNILDYEKQNIHNFAVIVKDHGTPSLATKTNVWISVKDLNDNFPKFVEPSFTSKLTVQATRGQFITIAKAYDLDYSDCDNLIYKIVDGNQLQIFSIDEKYGIITLQNLQNFTDSQQTFLNVSVTDGIHTSFSRVKIMLLPENLHAPMFDKSVYEVRIMENSVPGIKILTLQAQDQDFGIFSKLNYDICSDEMKMYFEIDETSGNLTTKVSFDREERVYYDIPIKSTDGGGKIAFTMVKVKIDDENDNSPYFDMKEYKVMIYEAVPLNSTILKVTALDLDEQLNGSIKYQIDEATLNAAYKDNFKINENNGDVIILRKPDNLYNTIVQFFVKAFDTGTPQLHSIIPVSIQFIDNGAAVPAFEKEIITLNPLESTAPGSTLTKLRISGNFSVKFSIATETTKFDISENGELILMQTLDREVADVHHIVVIVETRTIPTLFDYADIYIQVQDENDNSPKFDSNLYTIEVAENMEKASTILKILAIDADSGPNGDIRYYLEDNRHSISNIFDIDIYSGWITLLTSFDKEVQSDYNFNVLATDNGQPKHAAKVPVIIKLIDYNDNPPKFKENIYNLSVYENALPGTVLVDFVLTDADSTKSSVDFYILSGDKHAQFQISSSGELFVSKPLDRETISVYNISVLATDGKFSSSSIVLITVVDVNDNVPFCIIPRYNIDVNESISIGTPLINILALDADEGGNKVLRYYLTGSESDDFVIEKDIGLLKVANVIDRELHSQYILNAHVQDGHELSRECVSEIIITVNDLNDNKPQFSMQQYIVSIYEDAQVQSIVTKIHATDKDFGINRKIYYSFEGKNDYFSICHANGIVKLSKPLDRENISIFNITIKAEDHGTPKLFTIAQLIINILDINDNPPQFSLKQYMAYIPENTTVNSTILKIVATSKDIGINAEIMYNIIGGNEQNKFSIESKSGVIYLNNELDYEKTKTYFLTVQAVDGGSPPLSNLASVNISILDINDNKPVFSPNIYRIKIKEDVAIGYFVVQVCANDGDSKENSVIKYNIESGDKLNQFSMDEKKGYINISSSLDRESLRKYQLEVKACDNGTPELCNKVKINIEVIDVNDNAPIFSDANYSIVIQENKELGYNILNFDITDADEYPNTSPYTFDFRSGNEGGLFRLEPDGTLRTAARFNHKVCNLYKLQVRVFDNGTPPLYSDAWLNIKIIEESQYPPIITPLEISVNSFDDDFNGGFLGRVYASDQDKFDTLTFDLSPSLERTFVTNNFFNISRYDGSLYAINNLDIGLYKINVTVSDNKYISNATVKINVELITIEMVNNAALIKFSNVSPEDFILSNRKGFIRAIRDIMHCRIKDIIMISIQKSHSMKLRSSTEYEKNNPNRRQRSYSNNLDVVFSVRKQQITPTSEAYFTIEEMHSTIINNINKIEDYTNLMIEDIGIPKCSKNTCIHGQCINRIMLKKNAASTYYTDVISFVSPIFKLTEECRCKQGFDGKTCNESVNACSSDPCPPQKHCYPSNSEKGFQCICPKGYNGEFCENKSDKCQTFSCLNSLTSVSFGGKSYAHYKINTNVAKNTLENKFMYSLRVRTVQQTGTLLYASGKVDYNSLEIINGAAQYRFELGSGEGIISVSSIFISDGEWHTIALERILNSAKLVVDNKHVSQGSAPGVNGILNIQSNDIFVGAKVKPHPSILGFEDIQLGFIGCMADITIAFEPLPLYISGGSSVAALKRFTNVEFTCDPSNVLIHLGICGAQPCLNGGICTDLGNNNFKCLCHTRFTGKMCELDLDPCTSTPCLFGGRCNFISPGNFTCSCPSHLSGKRCEYGKFCIPNPCKNGGICEEGDGGPHCMCRGYTGPTCEIDVNECENQPCGNGATCINEAGSFRCICPSYLTGASCGDPLYSNSISTQLKNFSIEHITGIVLGIIVVFLFVIFILFCIVLKKQNSGSKNASTNVYKEANLNSLMDKERLSKHNNPKLSNLEINRPSSYSFPSGNENMFPSNTTFVNNLDILRSYGSAGDELENIPFEYQKMNRSNQQLNINSCNFNEIEPINKRNWCEQMHLKTFTENKINNEKKIDYESHLNHLASLKPSCGKLIQVPIPTVGHSGDYSSISYGQYHWDCSDWVRKSHNPLPDITEVPGVEVIDSSSFHSNESNGSQPRSSSCVIQNMGEVDPSRDITTLNEDLTSEYIDSELECCMQPFNLPIIKEISLSRLSPIINSENEDYKMNTGTDYLRHPNSYLPPLNTPSETEAESSTNEDRQLLSTVNNGNEIENSEEMFLFGHIRSNIDSNSDISEHLCEIEDSELEEFLPATEKNIGISPSKYQ